MTYKIRLTATPFGALHMNMQHFLWTVPFICFLVGYTTTQWLFAVKTVTTPNLMGKQVHEVLPLIAHYHVHIQLINQKEELNIPEGVILTQTPLPGAIIKPYQSIFVVTTKKPTAFPAPQCINMPLEELMPLLAQKEIIPKIYTLSHPYPEKVCFAQFPIAGNAISDNQFILYTSSGNNKPIIWPSFIGLSYQKTKEFLNKYDIIPHIVSEFLYNDHALVLDQRPVAGTLLTIDTKQPPSVQLKIG